MSEAILPTYARANISFQSGKGCYLYTDTGERYLDFGAGVAVNSLGHAHPVLVAAIKAQAEKLWHVSNLYQIKGQERLAKRLCENSFADKVFFNNSGAEAMECAIKMARKYHSSNGQVEKYRIITFEGGFHGRTLATIAAGGQEKHLAGFGPVVDGFDQVPLHDREAVQSAISEQTAAILIEPIQGEGGICQVDPAFLKFLRQVCDQEGLLLIFDEVQTGIGRTGHLFCYQASDIKPDILASAKGLGGGFPIGACLATDHAAIGMTAGSHGSTFGGNPLAMAVANAVLDEVLAPDFLPAVREKSLLLKQKLCALVDLYPAVFESLRGEGLMLGLKCKMAASDVVKAGLEAHLLTVAAGDNVVRLLPPLIVEDEEINAAIEALELAAQRLIQQSQQSSDQSL